MKKLLISVLMIAALLASGCISDKDATTEEPTDNISQPDTAPLIPREVLFGNPDKALARLSPDGTRISYLAPVNGVLNVWVGPADEPDSAEPVTNDTYRGISTYFWAYTNEHILYTQEPGW